MAKRVQEYTVVGNQEEVMKIIDKMVRKDCEYIDEEIKSMLDNYDENIGILVA